MRASTSRPLVLPTRRGSRRWGLTCRLTNWAALGWDSRTLTVEIDGALEVVVSSATASDPRFYRVWARMPQPGEAAADPAPASGPLPGRNTPIPARRLPAKVSPVPRETLPQTANLGSNLNIQQLIVPIALNCEMLRCEPVNRKRSGWFRAPSLHLHPR